VIGCGAISAQHLAYLQAAPRVDLVGVCDLSPALASWTADTYGTVAYTDHRAMLEVARPEVVHVLTPPASHEKLALDALDAGANVVVEKPAADDGRRLRSLLAAAEERGLLLTENQNYRYNDGVMAVAEALRTGSLGELVSIQVSMALGLAGSALDDPNVPSPVGYLPGGALRDFLPHLAGLVLHLTGDGGFGDVRAEWRNNSGSERLHYDELHAVFDADGVRGLIDFDARLTPEHFSITALGTAGNMTVDLFQPHTIGYRSRGPQVFAPLINQVTTGVGLVSSAFTGLRNKVMQHTPYHGLPRLLDAFYTAVETGGPAPLSPEVLVRSADLVDAIVAQSSDAEAATR
jgi:predicted dehydrogenase